MNEEELARVFAEQNTLLERILATLQRIETSSIRIVELPLSKAVLDPKEEPE